MFTGINAPHTPRGHGTHVAAVVDEPGEVATLGSIDDGVVIHSEHVAAPDALVLVALLSHVCDHLRETEPMTSQRRGNPSQEGVCKPAALSAVPESPGCRVLQCWRSVTATGAVTTYRSVLTISAFAPFVKSVF